ncbi:hypothetical protein AUJ84_03460 [Candidatus Pacearchaeota archaeon CG1_02_32_132]|nr:MAG: hypothetical protein AUJ84_03460 [Candidatus Pacearchaeota archaeon CG1_02_32_132]
MKKTKVYLSILAIVLILSFIAIVSSQEITSDPQSMPLWLKRGMNIFNLNKGNVGIGTQEPAQKLEVNGGIRINPEEIRPECAEKISGTLWVNEQELGNSLEFCKKLTEREGEQLIIKSSRLPNRDYSFSCVDSSATNKIYCFGGADGRQRILEYNPTEDIVIQRTLIPSAIEGLSCTESSINNKIYCFGGYRNGYTNQIFSYDAETDSISIEPAVLPQAAGYLSCVSSSTTNKIYCFGGNDGNRLNQIIEYNPLSNDISIKNAMLPSPRNSLSCAEGENNKIYCFGGGDNNGYLDEIMEYDPETDYMIGKSARLPSPRYGLSCVKGEIPNTIQCFGGYLVDQIIEYNYITDSLTLRSVNLPTPLYYLSCASSSANYRSYCFGGLDESSSSDRITEYFIGTGSSIYRWTKVA